MPLPSTKSGIQASDIRADYLFGLISHLKEVSSLSDTLLTNKIRSVEDDFERDLNLYFQTKVIMSEPPSNLVQGTDYDIAEPAYDYNQDFFEGERWGYIRLRRYPIQSVQSIVFAFPTLDTKVFTVPPSWIKVDDPFGMIRLVPTQAAIFASFTGYIFSLMSGGRGLPQSLYVNYTAGYGASGALQSNDQDILEHVKQKAVLEILDAGFMPGSFSTSGDGLSQSISTTMKDYREAIKAKRTQLRNKIKGIRLAVL